MTNGIRKVRKGVNIFDKRILILVSSSQTQCFRIQPRLHQSFPCSRQSSASIQDLQSSCLYPRFTEFLSLSRVYRVPVSIQGLQSSCLYPGLTEFPSLSRVFRVSVSIQGLQSFCLYPGFTEFLSLSRV